MARLRKETHPVSPTGTAMGMHYMFEASSTWAAGRVAGEHARHYLRCRETGTLHPPTSWKHLLMPLSFQLLITQQIGRAHV